ncbi:MAG TPA: Ku protein [Clostridiales bacterium]|nr:Ku protein [Clostridiales bacterium]HOL91885.1 Ku protein [Clostridiales bacterium]
MKTSWKGSISFGMVYFPVNVYTATSGSVGVKLNYLHRKCNSRIRYRKFCDACNEEVSQDDIVKGYEYEKDKYVVIADEDFEKLPIKSKKVISISHFVDEDEVDPIYLDKAYFISPGNFSASKAFELFRRAMRETGKVGIAKISLTSNEYVAMIKPYDKGGMLLYLLYYSDEIKKTEEITELNYNVDIHDNELKMAISLIDNMTGEFDIGQYRNEYQDALKQLIQSKIEGKEVVSPPEAQSNIINLMEALKASVEAAKHGRTDSKKKSRGKSTGKSTSNRIRKTATEDRNPAVGENGAGEPADVNAGADTSAKSKPGGKRKIL